MSLDEIARGEAAQEVASAIIFAAGEVMRRHGDDPESIAILAAGFCLAIDGIAESINPTFKVILCRMIVR